jgi:hypothetical protein
MIAAQGLFDVAVHNRQFTVDCQMVNEGDLVSIDGSTGDVYLGEVPVEASLVVWRFEGEIEPDSDPLVHADRRRVLAVRTNAEGIGLCLVPLVGAVREGVGRLVRIAVTEGREARPGLRVGVCGGRGGDRSRCTSSPTPASTMFPVRRSGYPWPVWKRAGRRWRERVGHIVSRGGRGMGGRWLGVVFGVVVGAKAA